MGGLSCTRKARKETSADSCQGSRRLAVILSRRYTHGARGEEPGRWRRARLRCAHSPPMRAAGTQCSPSSRSPWSRTYGWHSLAAPSVPEARAMRRVARETVFRAFPSKYSSLCRPLRRRNRPAYPLGIVGTTAARAKSRSSQEVLGRKLKNHPGRGGPYINLTPPPSLYALEPQCSGLVGVSGSPPLVVADTKDADIRETLLQGPCLVGLDFITETED